jgi:hypothetical protein
MDLEKNNIETQVSLMKDIIYNDHNIFYHIQEKGGVIKSTLQGSVYNKEEDTYSIKKDDFNIILGIAVMLSSDRNFDQLGILAKSSVPDNEVKKKILAMLQKN